MRCARDVRAVRNSSRIRDEIRPITRKTTGPPQRSVAPELCTRTLLLYLLTSHQGVRLGSPKKFECLGSGADAKAAAGVPNVCPDCVRGQNE